MRLRDMRVGFIGAGNMAGAMLRGLLESPEANPKNVIISAAHEESLDKYKPLGVATTLDNARVVSGSDLVVIAVKPQKLAEALAPAADAAKGKAFVSVAAGVSIAKLSAMLPGAEIIRVMPNTPMRLGIGASGIAIPEGVRPETAEAAKQLISFTSLVREVREDELDTVTAISGSGPAYFYRIAKVMADFAAENGTDRDTAMALAARTMEGAAAMLRDSGMTPDELIRAVSSPGGTTLAALAAFDENKLDEALKAGLKACAERSKELGRA